MYYYIKQTSLVQSTSQSQLQFQSHFSPTEPLMTFQLTLVSPVVAGQELTVSYVNIFQCKQDRLSDLASRFECGCERCRICSIDNDSHGTQPNARCKSHQQPLKLLKSLSSATTLLSSHDHDGLKTTTTTTTTLPSSSSNTTSTVISFFAEIDVVEEFDDLIRKEATTLNKLCLKQSDQLTFQYEYDRSTKDELQDTIGQDTIGQDTIGQDTIGQDTIGQDCSSTLGQDIDIYSDVAGLDDITIDSFTQRMHYFLDQQILPSFHPTRKLVLEKIAKLNLIFGDVDVAIACLTQVLHIVNRNYPDVWGGKPELYGLLCMAFSMKNDVVNARMMKLMQEQLSLALYRCKSGVEFDVICMKKVAKRLAEMKKNKIKMTTI
jgi:hypothetical protein